MRRLWIAASLLIASSAWAACPPGEGKIGYSFCAHFTVVDIKARPAWFTKFFFGKQTYNHRRVLKVKVKEAKIPQMELQAKDAPLRIMPGTLLKLGISDADHQAFQMDQEGFGLVEEECHDKGEADYEYVLNPKLADYAVGPGGSGRDKEIQVDCNPPAAVPVPAPVSDTKEP